MEQTVAPKPGARRWRTAGTVLSWAAAITAPLWAIVRLFGLESSLLASTPATQLMAFTPYVAVLSVIPLLLALGNRRWRTAAVALAATVALAFCVIPRTIAAGQPSTAKGGPELRLLTANLSLGDADAAKLVQLVREQRADVLAVQELTPEEEVALGRAGLARLLPYFTDHPSALAAGSAVFSRYPIFTPRVHKNHGGFYQASATVMVPGGHSVVVESVHVCSPFSLDQNHCWRTDLAQEPGAKDAAASPDAPLRILAGDFNSTLDHAPLRDLIDRGYRDSADAVGTGWDGTWGPYTRHPFIPPVALDHVLVDERIGVRAVTVHGVPRTDHRAVLVVLTLPPAKP